MMKELIKITEQSGKKAVSARELHTFLESKQQFADWIKNRITEYGFTENQDFEVFHNFMKNPSGGRPLTEYALTVNMAKELSMVEGNDKGKQARRYFIACEEKAILLLNNQRGQAAISDARDETISFDRLPFAVSQMMAKLTRIEKLLSQPAEPTKPQRFDFNGALAYINGLGYTFSKSKLQKFSATGDIPCHKFNRRLVFVKNELDAWLESQTVTVGESSAALTLARCANKKMLKTGRRR